ncbi:MAG: adenosylhomocysteinase [Methylobacter sp.]
MTNSRFDIKDLSLADQGRERVEWALTEMPVLSAIHDRFIKGRSLEGARISGCLHITTETANLARILKVDLENAVYPVPTDIDQQVAVMKLAAMRLNIDSLSPEQQTYLSSWKEGT